MPGMRDKDKTQDQLIKEVTELRRRIIELEGAETERKQAEGALRESEEELEAIFNEVRDGIVLLDLTGKIIKINKRIAEATGYTEKYIVGKRFDFFKNFTFKSIAKMIPAFSKVVAGLRVSPFEVEGYTKTGEKRIGEICGSLLQKKGKAAGVLVVMTDITERKQAEEALRESEGRYRTLIDNIDLGITLIDVYHNIIMVNAAQSAKFNKPVGEIIGKKCFREFEKRDAVCPHCPGVQTMATNQPAEVETEGIRDDGSRFQVRLQTFPVSGQDGTVIGFIETAVDISKSRRMEEELRESERRYRAILETMEEGYYEIDLAGNFTFFNEAECRIHGCSHDEMIGLNNQQYSSPETAKRIYKIFNKVYRTGIPAKIVDYEVTRKNGSVAMIETSVSLLRNAAGGPIGFYGISRDRTEQKKAEEILRQSEEKYRTILETMEDAYYEADLAGNLTFFNDSMCRIHGYPRDELMGMNNREYMDKETAKRVYKIFNTVFRTGKGAKIHDWQIIRKDGFKRDVEASVSLMRDIGGNPQGFRGVIRDVTERKQAEEALRQSEEKYRTILENIENGYYEVDLAGNLIFFNDSLCKIFGYPRDELMGMNNREYMSPETAKRTYQLFNEVYKKGEPTKIFDWEFIKIDGSTLNVEISISLMRDSKGEPVGFRGILRDVTERKQAEEALRESVEKYRSLVEFTEDSVYLVNRRKEYLFANETYLTRLGFPRDHVIGRPYDDFHAREDGEAFSEHIEKVLKTGRFVQYEHRSQTDGRYFLRTLSPVKEPDGSIETVTVIAKDITGRKQAEEELQYIATHDALTGVPNRALFNDRLTLALTQADRNKKKLAVMLLDLDYFKDVNDTLGHSMGDQLLRVVGNRLTELLRKGDTVARVGGDEFLLLLAEIARIKDANIIARKILDAFRKPFVLDDHEIMITTSIGVSIYPDDGADANTLTKHADVAMYRAKDKGRDNFQRYTPA
jgi:diguanylate cyclase (GGDEF)-like protein/PAS domain S-box-containing protein